MYLNICTRSILDDNPLSDRVSDVTKEYINCAVIKYGISPIADVAEDYVSIDLENLKGLEQKHILSLVQFINRLDVILTKDIIK